MKIEKLPRETNVHHARPWEERDALRVSSDEASRERRRTEEVRALNQVLQGFQGS